VGQAPAANVPLEIHGPGPHSYGPDAPHIFTQHEVTTGPDGRFVFDRVFPGHGRIGRSITFMVNDGATEVTSACAVRAEFPAGKTIRIDLGGTGRPVVGRLQAPEGFQGQVRWSFVRIAVGPVPAEREEGSPFWTVTVDRDGRFRIDDVPAGNYVLSLQFDRYPAGALPEHRFRVAAAEGDGASQPVELGNLRLEPGSK
jgi:hypothetical protein